METGELGGWGPDHLMERWEVGAGCLENPRDGGAWWAAVYGVAQSRTGLKQLSSSSKGAQESCKPYRS